MSDRMVDEELADLAYDEAEGTADSVDEMDELDGAEAFDDEDIDAMDEGDLATDEMDDWDAGDEEAYYDEMDEGDVDVDYGEEDYGDEGDESDLEEAMALALGAEDTDEFFRRAFGALRRVARGAGQIARRAAPVIGRIARTAAPLARAIPLPWARAAGPILNLLGQLRAEGATDEEALDAFAELAAHDESVIPVVAGLAARSVIGPRIARMPVAVRRRVVRGMATAARTLARRRGPAAVRVLPRVVRSVRRAAVVRRTPPAARPRVVATTIRRIVRSPQLVRRLARPTVVARQRVARVVRRARIVRPGAVRARSYVMRGPVRISIAPA